VEGSLLLLLLLYFVSLLIFENEGSNWETQVLISLGRVALERYMLATD